MALTNRGHHTQKGVSHSQNGKAVDGSHIPSSVRNAVFNGFSIPKKGQFLASVGDAVADDAQVTADGTVNVYNGVVDANDAFIAGSGGLSSDLQGGPSTDPVRSESRVGGAPKKGSSWASFANASSDDDVIAGKKLIAGASGSGSNNAGADLLVSPDSATAGSAIGGRKHHSSLSLVGLGLVNPPPPTCDSAHASDGLTMPTLPKMGQKKRDPEHDGGSVGAKITGPITVSATDGADAGSDGSADCFVVAGCSVGAMSSDRESLLPNFSSLQTPAKWYIELNLAGSGVLHLDLRGSELCDPDPRVNGSRGLEPHEGSKALPSTMMSGVTKLLPAWESSGEGTGLALSPVPTGEKTKNAATEHVFGVDGEFRSLVSEALARASSVPGRSRGEGRSSIIGRGSGELDVPLFRAVMVKANVPDRPDPSRKVIISQPARIDHVVDDAIDAADDIVVFDTAAASIFSTSRRGSTDAGEDFSGRQVPGFIVDVASWVPDLPELNGSDSPDLGGKGRLINDPLIGWFELGAPDPAFGGINGCFAGKESVSVKVTSGKATDCATLIRSVQPCEQNVFVVRDFQPFQAFLGTTAFGSVLVNGSYDNAGQGRPLFVVRLVWLGHGRYRVVSTLSGGGSLDSSKPDLPNLVVFSDTCISRELMSWTNCHCHCPRKRSRS